MFRGWAGGVANKIVITTPGREDYASVVNVARMTWKRREKRGKLPGVSAHFSKYLLNSFAATAYFEAHCPPDYPVSRVLIASRAFRNLSPRLRELALLSNVWLQRQPGGADVMEEMSRWYDAEGYELDPGSGRRLSIPVILADWGEVGNTLPSAVSEDIPLPLGGFADPLVWEPPPVADDPELVDRTGFMVERLLSDIASRGRRRTAEEYGVPPGWLHVVCEDKDLAEMILNMHGKPWPQVS